MKQINELTRPNILALKPYSCARDEYKGKEATVFLDANESPYNEPYNRYPDPLQAELKEEISRIKHVPAECIFLGNGSDEAIDLLFRAFCEPRTDNVVAIDPTYGMYSVCADINDVEYRRVLLDESYSFSARKLLEATDEHTKLIFLCSPNNPTGNSLPTEEIEAVLRDFPGLVVLDEAYIDFASHPGFAQKLPAFPNLILLQTFSKAWASAGIRLGMAFASAEIIQIFNKIKYPYNVNLLTQQQALDTLRRQDEINHWVQTLLEERQYFIESLSKLPIVQKIYPTDANFFLALVEDADQIYHYLVETGIIVRNRSSVSLCRNCLRITIGTRQENDALLASLRNYPSTSGR